MREQGHIEPMAACYGIAHYEYTRTPSKEKPQQFADDVCDPAQLDTANTLLFAVVNTKAVSSGEWVLFNPATLARIAEGCQDL